MVAGTLRNICGWQILTDLLLANSVIVGWSAVGCMFAVLCSISGWQILTDFLLANCVIVGWSAVWCTVAEHLPIYIVSSAVCLSGSLGVASANCCFTVS